MGFRCINYYQIWVSAASRPQYVAVTSAFGKLRLAHPDRINHLWTLSFCASFAGTASTVNNWTYSLVEAVNLPKKFFITAGAVLRISGNKERHVWPFWVSRYLKFGQKQAFDSSLKSYFKCTCFWVSYFDFSKFLMKKQPVHMRYHLFLQYGLFLQNLGKDFIRTNMLMTVTT